MQEQGAAPWPLVVIGAGAAGLLAAIFAGRRGIPVLMLDTRRQPGAKIRVSGGSRCNVLPSRAALEDFHTSGSHKALRNILFSWPLSEVHDFFQRELGVPLKTEPTGKVFPVSDRSKDVVDALLGEAARVGVCLRGQARVAALRVAGDGFELTLEGGEPILARRVVLATGGKSLPRTGSDGGGWRLASGLGHTVLPTYPALVPLLTPDPAWRALAGVALPVSLQAERAGRPIASVAGDFLFTHTGFSGPAALDISRHFAAPGGGDVALVARWSALDGPGWEQALARDGARPVAPLVREHLPRRLAAALLQRAGLHEEQRRSTLTRGARLRLVEALTRCPLQVSGNEGYRTAEVTAGGIPLEEVHTRSLESRRVPGLYLCGEVLDVTGKLGGYNFLWAWVSGRRVGAAIPA